MALYFSETTNRRVKPVIKITTSSSYNWVSNGKLKVKQPELRSHKIFNNTIHYLLSDLISISHKYQKEINDLRVRPEYKGNQFVGIEY